MSQDGYEMAVRKKAAGDGAAENCVSRRWKLGWASYPNAGVAHDSEARGTR
jgi:hypothetical protein